MAGVLAFQENGAAPLGHVSPVEQTFVANFVTFLLFVVTSQLN